MKNRGKGSQFERTIAKQLSLWWSYDEHDDLFWRTSQSGGRATQRGKKNQRTLGHYGDICATGPEGQALIDMCTIELKTGYKGADIMDLVDHLPKHSSLYDQFICQAKEERNASGTEYWVLIARRFSKDVMIYFPKSLWKRLIRQDKKIGHTIPFVHIRCKMKNSAKLHLVGTLLSSFLKSRRIRAAFEKIIL